LIQKDRDFLIDIAKKYYLEGLSQQQIANFFKISRPSVSNLLKQCREDKIVDIRIQESESSLVNALSERLKKDFNLKLVVVVPSKNDPGDTLVSAGAAASKLLESELKNSIKIGISWGTSLYQMVEALPPQSMLDMEIIQLVGSLGMANPSFDGFELARKLSRKLNGSYHLIQAPIVVKNIKLKKLLLQEHPISETVKKMNQIDLALLGISSDNPEDSSLVREGFTSLKEATQIQSMGGIGHICGYHFNKAGKILDIPENKGIIGIDIKQMRNIPKVIGVACGSEKAEAILGAIRSGLINGIVTDENTVLKILSSVQDTA
jgi:deoxyribonucleoside regulator